MNRKILLSLIIMLVGLPVFAAKREPWNAEGKYKRAFVVDNGLAALRKEPSPYSMCLRRLRLGRSLYVISSHQGKDGIPYYYVAVTRRTRGYIDRAAVAAPSRRGDDARLMRLISESKGPDQIMLSRLLSMHFAGSKYRADALLAEAEASEEAARELSRRASRRPPRRLDEELPERRYLINYSGLDRYSRLGVRFRLDEENELFHYDGEAYKKILSRFPKSDAAPAARERLLKLTHR